MNDKYGLFNPLYRIFLHFSHTKNGEKSEKEICYDERILIAVTMGIDYSKKILIKISSSSLVSLQNKIKITTNRLPENSLAFPLNEKPKKWNYKV